MAIPTTSTAAAAAAVKTTARISCCRIGWGGITACWSDPLPAARCPLSVVRGPRRGLKAPPYRLVVSSNRTEGGRSIDRHPGALMCPGDVARGLQPSRRTRAPAAPHVTIPPLHAHARHPRRRHSQDLRQDRRRLRHLLRG